MPAATGLNSRLAVPERRPMALAIVPCRWCRPCTAQRTVVVASWSIFLDILAREQRPFFCTPRNGGDRVDDAPQLLGLLILRIASP